ncbi:hypothetical protein [Sodalis glossinidius]|uniref:hypothetical protein n=1 Tax=Sodalis glossinidius TaxID=63612 RepID=UPI0011D0FD5E|nr:hypothetical protein [Sodalis glossinidius]
MTTFSPALEKLNVYLFQLINAPAAISAGMLRVGMFFASDAVALFPLVLLFDWFWRGEEQKKPCSTPRSACYWRWRSILRWV